MIASAIVIGAMRYGYNIVVKMHGNRKMQKFIDENTFTIRFGFGTSRHSYTYVPWVTKLYESYEQLEFDEEQIVDICHNPDKNAFWREAGIAKISIVRTVDNADFFSVALINERRLCQKSPTKV